MQLIEVINENSLLDSISRDTLFSHSFSYTESIDKYRKVKTVYSPRSIRMRVSNSLSTREISELKKFNTLWTVCLHCVWLRPCSWIFFTLTCTHTHQVRGGWCYKSWQGNDSNRMELDEQFPNVERETLETKCFKLDKTKLFQKCFVFFFFFECCRYRCLPFQTLTIDLHDLCVL